MSGSECLEGFDVCIYRVGQEQFISEYVIASNFLQDNAKTLKNKLKRHIIYNLFMCILKTFFYCIFGLNF